MRFLRVGDVSVQDAPYFSPANWNPHPMRSSIGVSALRYRQQEYDAIRWATGHIPARVTARPSLQEIEARLEGLKSDHGISPDTYVDHIRASRNGVSVKWAPHFVPNWTYRIASTIPQAYAIGSRMAGQAGYPQTADLVVLEAKEVSHCASDASADRLPRRRLRGGKLPMRLRTWFW